MATLEDLSILLQNLPNSTNIVLSLTELQTALTSVSPAVLASFVPKLSFSSLFEHLDTDERKQLECCCDVLKKLLQPVLPSVIITSFRTELVTGLQHRSQFVVELCLTQILRVVNDNPQHIVKHTDIIEAIIQLLSSDHSELSGNSLSILIKLGSNVEGIKVLFGNQMSTLLKNVAKTSESVRFRVYEVVVKVVIASPNSLKYFSANHGEVNLLSMLINELSPNNPDVLGKLNALEFASQLVSCLHGFHYLDDQGFINTMERSMEESLNNSFLLHGYMKFFGCLCYVQPALVNSRLKNFINIVFSSIAHRNFHMLPIAIETLGLIGSTKSGKLALDKSGNAMISCLPVIGELILQSSSELRMKALQTLQQLMLLPVEDQSPDILEIMENWFNKLFSKDPVSQILPICRQPFNDLKCTALSVMKCLANVTWGQNTLKNSAGFEEYLLDRRTESSKEGLEAKFEIVQTLLQSPSTYGIFGNAYYLKLREYEREGRFYVSAEHLTAFERAE